MTYTNVVVCDDCDKILSVKNTRHFCNRIDKNKPKWHGLYGHTGEWVD